MMNSLPSNRPSFAISTIHPKPHRYDHTFKAVFGFEKEEKRDVSMRMPLRFVWGLRPRDDGDPLDPAERGSLSVDPDFDISSKDAQRWMLKFCEDVRKQVRKRKLQCCVGIFAISHLSHIWQPFFAPSVGPSLSNCFIQTFKEWMDMRCKDPLSGINRAPCCQASRYYALSLYVCSSQL